MSGVEIVDLPPDGAVRMRVAGWVAQEWQHLFPGDTPEWYLEEWSRAGGDASEPPFCVVAMMDAEPVGTASVFADDELEGATEPGPWLAAVYVLPACRGAGIGRALVAAAVARAARPMWLYTESEEAWYSRMGWETVRRAEMNSRPVTVMHHAGPPGTSGPPEEPGRGRG